MSNIVTFYSYKGGVGRSMAMANVALLLARRGLRVLAVDWDLEAPGLERYFSYFKTEPFGNGLLNLLIAQRDKAEPAIDEYLWRIEGEIEGKPFRLSLLPSGKEADSEYAAKLERFDWESYFAGGGGDYIESLRERWLKDYDVTLIDSRTGLSDSGGICTIQLPDIAVAMFTANYQSLYGVRDIMRFAQAARNDLAYDRMHLAVLPLPARFGSRTEFREAQEWLGRFAEVMGEFYKDWLPKWLDPRQVVEALKVPQVDFFGFGEKLAVKEQGTSDPDGMGFVYDRVASLLSSDLKGAETVLRIEAPAKPPLEVGQQNVSDRPDYEYDVFVSYAHEPVLSEWLRAFVDQLRTWLAMETGREPRFFFDYQEVNLGGSWSEKTVSALVRSKLFLAVVTPRYVESEYCQREWHTFSRQLPIGGSGSPVIVPILLRQGTMIPEWVGIRYFDLSDIPLHASAFTDKSLSLQTSVRIKELAGFVASALGRVPPFDPHWRTVEVADDIRPRKIDGLTMPLGNATGQGAKGRKKAP